MKSKSYSTQSILDALTARGGKATVSELAQDHDMVTEMQQKSLAALVARMAADGKIVRYKVPIGAQQKFGLRKMK